MTEKRPSIGSVAALVVAWGAWQLLVWALGKVPRKPLAKSKEDE